MKRTVPPVLAFLAALAWTVPGATAGEIRWVEASFPAILARAADEGKPILIDFYAVWCGPCKLLDKNVWTDPRVRELAETAFIPVKIDAEKGEGVELARRYRVFSYPNIVFLDPDGTERDRWIGYQPADGMLAFMEDMAANRNTADQLMAATPATSGDVAKVFEVGERLNNQSRKEEAEPYLLRALELDAGNDAGYAVKALLTLADAERKQERFEEAVAYAERVVAGFGDEAEAVDEALSSIAYYYRKMNRMEEAAGTYRRMIERHPEDPGVLNAFAWFAATNGVALEEATGAAEKAVRLSEGNPGYLDTLAECFFARGMFGEAIATIDKAIAREPEDEYFREQRAKFESARSGS